MFSYLLGWNNNDKDFELTTHFNKNTIFNCEIQYTDKKINYLKFTNQAFNLYIVLYSHPTWNSSSKQVEYRLRCNELFYPQRKTINYYYSDKCKEEDNKIKFFINGKIYEVIADGINIKIK